MKSGVTARLSYGIKKRIDKLRNVFLNQGRKYEKID